MEPRRIVDLAQLTEPAFFREIAKGLDLIHENSMRIWESVALLVQQEHFRAAEILKGHALEEAAKYLILLDAIRCPRESGGMFSRQLRKFNSHVARGLYVEVCDWRPANMKEVREGIERECKAYYLDGPNDVDWIFRNDIKRKREEALYVDYVVYDETHDWVSPSMREAINTGMFFNYEPIVLRLIGAFHEAGIGKAEALESVAKVWRPHRFTDDSDHSELRGTIVATLQLLDERGILLGTDEFHHDVVEYWPFPLYDFPMQEIRVDKSELQEIQKQWYPPI